MNFPKLAEVVHDQIIREGKDKIDAMDDIDIEDHILDIVPDEYGYEHGTGDLRDKFIRKVLKEFRGKYNNAGKTRKAHD